MADDYMHNLPRAAYRAGLLAELNTVPMTREKKAAIVAELEAIGPRTSDEDRAAVEAASLGPVTVGRAPSVAVVQAADTVVASQVTSVAEPAPVAPPAVTVVTSGENNGTAAQFDPDDSGR